MKDWYYFLWNNIDHSFENIDKHNIHFLTFNYERSLEQFLFTSLYNSYAGKKSAEDCAKKIMTIDINHIYGCLAPLPWQKSSYRREYKPKPPTISEIDQVVHNLRLIGEERFNKSLSSNFQKIESIMGEAKYIYFLGFSFDEENLKVLGNNFANAEKIWGTSLDLGPFKERKAITLIQNKKIKDGRTQDHEYFIQSRVKLFPITVLEFLRTHIDLKAFEINSSKTENFVET